MSNDQHQQHEPSRWHGNEQQQLGHMVCLADELAPLPNDSTFPFKNFRLCNINTEPFVVGSNDPLLLKMTHMYGRIRTHHEASGGDHARLLMAVGEAMPVYVRSRHKMPEVPAKAAFVSDMISLFPLDQVSFLVPMVPHYQAWVSDTSYGWRQVKLPSTVSGTAPSQNSLTRMTPAEAAELLRFLTFQIETDPVDVEMTISVLLSISRRGVSSQAFIDHVIDMVNSDMHLNVMIKPRVVELIWSIYGSAINETNVKYVAKYFTEFLPRWATRLRSQLQPCPGEGLTTVRIIVKALKRHPVFPWTYIQTMFPIEMQAVLRAIDAIRHNEFFGYSKDLRSVSSYNFQHVAYIAKELLVRVCGETNLLRYRGLSQPPTNRLVLDELIHVYTWLHTHSPHSVFSEMEFSNAVNPHYLAAWSVEWII